MRQRLIAGNWKMHGSRAENARRIETIAEAFPATSVACAVCPPFVYLAQVGDLLRAAVDTVGKQITHAVHLAWRMQRFTGVNGLRCAADSWLDLEHTPYRLHFKASLVHGEPIVIEVSENTRRLTIYRQGDPAAVLLAGAYWIDPSHDR